MEPRQALDLLTQVTGALQLSRQDHLAVQSALNVVGDCVEQLESAKGHAKELKALNDKKKKGKKA